MRDHLQEAGALEAAFVRRAWKQDDHRELSIRDVSLEFGARRPARESREASLKLGRRFAELVNSVTGAPLLETDLHYCVAFGAAGAVLGVRKTPSCWRTCISRSPDWFPPASV